MNSAMLDGWAKETAATGYWRMSAPGLMAMRCVDMKVGSWPQLEVGLKMTTSSVYWLP